MEPCSECGNEAMVARLIEGVTVAECELCGALSGSPTAVRRVLDARAARELGVDPGVFGLTRALGGLAGLRVDGSSAGDRAEARLPHVACQLVDLRGLVQIENLAKSLLLSARALALPWVLEVEFRDALVFVLRPRAAQRRATESEVAGAQADLQILQRAVERDSRLSWWRHPGAAGATAVG